MRRVLGLAFSIFALFLCGYFAGYWHHVSEVRALADSIEHQNAFGACLAERWEQTL